MLHSHNTFHSLHIRCKPALQRVDHNDISRNRPESEFGEFSLNSLYFILDVGGIGTFAIHTDHDL